ncbi:unnamed protein product, partial [Symbiodinium sp. KB8]
ELRALFNALAQRPIQACDVAYRDWGLQCGLDIRQILLDGDQTDTDAGLFGVAVSTLAMDILVFPDVQEALGEEEDPPKHIPQEMAQLIRVVATLEGSASRCGRCLRVLPLWSPILSKAGDEFCQGIQGLGLGIPEILNPEFSG